MEIALVIGVAAVLFLIWNIVKFAWFVLTYIYKKRK